MIFALIDFLQWGLRRGRYGDRQKSVMGLAAYGTLPRKVVNQFLPGDIVFTQRLDAWFSWFMMYFSSSPIDHCAVYVGNREVMHQTFALSSKDPLRYVTKGSRVLVCRLLDPRLVVKKRTRKPSRVIRFLHRYSAKVQLTWAACEMVLGFHPERFRWRFMGDLASLAIVVDLSLYTISPLPLGLCALLPLLAIASSNKLRWTIRRAMGRPLPPPASHPDLLLGALYEGGGLVFTNLGPLVFGPFGVLPLRAVQAIVQGDPGENELADMGKAREALRAILDYLEVLEPPDENAEL